MRIENFNIVSIPVSHIKVEDWDVLDDSRAGLYGEYSVTRLDGSSESGGKHEKCNYFVLDITHDPHAIPALLEYAVSCRDSHPQLSQDLISIVKSHRESII